MGADFVLYSCPSPRNLGLSDDEARSLLQEYALLAPRDAVDCYFVNFHPWGFDSLDEAYEDRDSDEPLQELAEAQAKDPALCWGRRFLAQELFHAFDVISGGGRRDVSTWTFQGVEYLISGGMSWGDNPTAAGPLLAKLAWSEVFALEENKKGVLELSTAHIPEELLAIGNPGMVRNGLYQAFLNRVQTHDYGYIIYLGEQDGDEDAAEWAQPILAMARRLSCDFINFDLDAAVCRVLRDYSKGSELEQLSASHEE